ncbi:MlaA family lipoprotein [Ramlibacter montanisoli]|uniref:VacJ family lipoprotein n=1 Tax=Ramlibacter montanisoli TaxID=2732512 RepID=A0A849KAI3_9BURK|nr:VacJ family lipoprotein [Ramlibacter montanisoli]NNU42055.1 VacJ family lipoprotein [Ramlibacter montanisoli]
MTKRRSVVATILAGAALLAAGAAAAQADPRDPLEPINRGVDALNQRVDRAAIQPVARAYERAVPSLVRRGASNFFANLGDVWSAANSVLQVKPGDAAQNFMRFAVNTTAGLAGVFDVATDIGIDRHKEDFGSTLARWGVPAGPYMVLPLMGPTTLRDAAGLPVDWAGHPLGQVSPAASRNAIAAAGAVDLRARLLPLDGALDQAFDRYTFMRDAYLQHRDAQVRDGEAAGAADAEPVAADGADPDIQAN